jgi:MoxR-like ATPase
MKFTPKFFDPGPVDPVTGSVTCSITPPLGKASVYVYDRPLILAINVALAANRPLLLAGEPGSGKTSLARNIALKLQWSYYETTITSRTQSTDLVWEFDALARLNAAYGGGGATLPRDEFFVRPGPLWWALAPDTAQRRGMEEGELAPTDKRLVDPGSPPGMPDAVLLVDELDKAEPEVPNDLLEIVDARS